MDKRVAGYTIEKLAECHGLEISENYLGGWTYAGTYATVIVTPEINGDRTDWVNGVIWRTLQIDVSISRMGDTTPVNMLRAALELKRVAEFAAELENMGLEYVEKRNVSA